MESFQENTEVAKAACRFALCQAAIPYAPHLYFPQYLDDENADERERGIVLGLSWLARCDELWIIGDRITEGMKREIDQAREWGITIRPVKVEKRKVDTADSEDCKEAQEESCMDQSKQTTIDQADIINEIGENVDREGMSIGIMISGLFKMASVAYCCLPIMTLSTEMIDVYREKGSLTVILRDPDVQEKGDDEPDSDDSDDEDCDEDCDQDCDKCPGCDFLDKEILDFLNDVEECVHED